MQKEVIWIFGASAAGKQTFIRRVVEDSDLARKLGWADKKIAACEISLNELGHVGDKEIVRLRTGISDSVASLLEKSDVVLIKWQYVDTHNKTPQKLLELLPNSKHKVILLKANTQEIHERLSTKDWWKEFWDNTDFANSEHDKVKDSLAELGSDMEMITLDSSDGQNYKIIK